MNLLASSSRSILSRLGLLLLHRYKPAQPLPTPRYTRHVNAAVRGSRSDVFDSILGLFSCHPLRAACSHSRLPISSRRWYHDPRKVAAAVLLPCAAAFTALGAFSHRETVPYTNRAHRVILSPTNERKLGDLGFEGFKEELGDKILGPSDPRTVHVRLIAADIIRGVYRAFPSRSRSDGDSGGDTSSAMDGGVWVNESRKQGDAAEQPQIGHLGDLKWEVIVVKDDRIRAGSMPGGKIVVSTRLLDYFKTDAEIATILAHEIGHVIARHFTEFTETIMLIPILYNLLPFSRKMEIEADVIGLMLLAATGFDPRVAAEVFEKLGKIEGDSAWCDYIGSHPSCKTRSRLLSRGKAIEEALELYYKQVCAGEGADRHFPYGSRSWETLVQH